MKILAREVATEVATADAGCPGPADTAAPRGFATDAGQDAERVIGGTTRAVPTRRLGTTLLQGAGAEGLRALMERREPSSS